MLKTRSSGFIFLIFLFSWASTTVSCSRKQMTNSQSLEGLVHKIKPKKVTIHGGEPHALDNENLQCRFFLVRHAEKEKDKKDPGLLPEGEARAKRLAELMKDIPLRRVYSTNYQRTQLTAAPVASDMHLQVTNYAPKGFAVIFDQLLRQPPLGNYLFVGHSNTISLMLNHLAGKEVYKNIPESEYNRLYVVSVYEDKRVKVLKLKY